MTLRGRHYVLFWLLVFLVVAGGVAMRQAVSVDLAKRLRVLREESTTLEARRADLERRIRAARSRGVLIPEAERLGLRLPADSQITVLPLTDGDRR